MKLFLNEHLLNQSSLLRYTFVSIFGSLGASILAAIALILLSRQFGPTHFGQFSSAFALVLILAKVNDLGLSVATTKLISKNDPLSQKISLVLITRYRLALSALIASFGILFTHWYCQSFSPSNCVLILLAFLFTFATSFFEHAQLSMQARRQFGLASLLNILQGFLKLLFILPFILWNWGSGSTPDYLVATSFFVYLLAPFVPVALILLIKPQFLGWSLQQPQNQEETNHESAIKSKVISICRQAGLGIVLISLIDNLDILLVQTLLNDYDTGLLAGASGIASVLAVIASAIGGVLNPLVTRFQSAAQLKRYWQKAWLVVAGSVLGFVASYFIAQPLLLLTLGPSFIEALPLLHYLLAAGFISIAITPFCAYFYTTKDQWYFTFAAVGQFILLIVGNLLMIPIWGVSGAVITRLIVKIILFFGTVWYVRKRVLQHNQDLLSEAQND